MQRFADRGSHASVEPLVEARTDDLAGLARLAWTLGDRHVPVQVMPDCVRLRPDAALEAVLRGLGARLIAVEAPFDPEGGAYLSGEPSHHHRHRHHGDPTGDRGDHGGDDRQRAQGHGSAAGGRDGRR